MNNHNDDNNLVIPTELQKLWEEYNDVCMSLEVIPSKKRFLRYNELYPENP